MKFFSKSRQEILIVGVTYTFIYYLIQWVTFSILITKYPSRYEDDIRIDIEIPAILIAYFTALFCAWITIVFIHEFSKRLFNFKRFVLFAVLIPIFYQIAELGLGFIAILSPAYNDSPYYVYRISLAVITLITVCVSYWFTFRPQQRSQ